LSSWDFPKKCVVEIPLAGESEPIRCAGTLDLDEHSSPVVHASWAAAPGSPPRGSLELEEPWVLAGRFLLVDAYASRFTSSLSGLRTARFDCARIVDAPGGSLDALEAARSHTWVITFVGLREWASIAIGSKIDLTVNPAAAANPFIGPGGKRRLAAATVEDAGGISVLSVNEDAMLHHSRTEERRSTNVTFRVSSRTPMGYDEFAERWLGPITGFVAFATGISLPVDEIRCVCNPEANPGLRDTTDSRRVIVRMLAQFHDAPQAIPVRPLATPLPFGTLANTPELLAAWLNVHATLGSRLDILCAGLGAPLPGLGARGAFIERIGFVESIREHVLKDPRHKAEDLLAGALSDAALALELDVSVAALAKDMVDARHYLMHMARGKEAIARAYRTSLAPRMLLFAETLQLVAYNDLLTALGFPIGDERREVLGRSSAFGKNLLAALPSS
jgi:hypothetical protein